MLGFLEMTPVQAQSLPLLLESKDVTGQARTGSGKTVAFGLALLSQVDVGHASLQSLVLCTTPELADQVSAEIRRLARFIQRSPIEVTVDTAPVSGEIQEIFYECEASARIDAVAALLGQHRPETTLVFCHTRNDTRDVAREFGKRGFSVLALHGEMEQRDRDNVLRHFAHRSCSVLVATDVAARGLDVEGLSAVITFELPRDPDVHQHRIGRTGRAGRKGMAFSLYAPPERGRLAALEGKRGEPVRWGRLQFGRGASSSPPPPPMVTLLIEGGRKDKPPAGRAAGGLT